MLSEKIQTPNFSLNLDRAGTIDLANRCIPAVDDSQKQWIAGATCPPVGAFGARAVRREIGGAERFSRRTLFEIRASSP